MKLKINVHEFIFLLFNLSICVDVYMDISKMYTERCEADKGSKRG